MPDLLLSKQYNVFSLYFLVMSSVNANLKPGETIPILVDEEENQNQDPPGSPAANCNQ